MLFKKEVLGQFYQHLDTHFWDRLLMNFVDY